MRTLWSNDGHGMHVADLTAQVRVGCNEKWQVHLTAVAVLLYQCCISAQ